MSGGGGGLKQSRSGNVIWHIIYILLKLIYCLTEMKFHAKLSTNVCIEIINMTLVINTLFITLLSASL